MESAVISPDRVFGLCLPAVLACSTAACSRSFGSGESNWTVTTDGPSCQSPGPGRTDCGADQENCCTSVTIPGGSFYRSYGTTIQGQLLGGTRGDPATVSPYRLDKYLVTVGRFRQFVAAFSGQNGGAKWKPDEGKGKHTHLYSGRGLQDSGSPGLFEPGWDSGDDSSLTSGSLACDPDLATWTSDPGQNENRPVNCVNWPLAYAFCIWDGGFLPSENEFEFATAAGGQQRVFPWGNEDPGASPDYVIYKCDYPPGNTTCTGVTNIAPVGTARLGAGYYGQLDLAGELNEWMLDYNAGYTVPCTDCAFLTHASGRSVRGGYFNSSSSIEILSSYRNEGLYPTNNFMSNGFRCARSPQ